MQAVREAHKDAREQEVNVLADRHSLAIGLQEEGTEASNAPCKLTINPPAAEVCARRLYHLYTSWITLFIPLPQIAMGVVLNYSSGRAIPHVRLQIRWGEDKNIPVELTGVVSPESFLLEHPQIITTGG